MNRDFFHTNMLSILVNTQTLEKKCIRISDPFTLFPYRALRVSCIDSFSSNLGIQNVPTNVLQKENYYKHFC